MLPGGWAGPGAKRSIGSKGDLFLKHFPRNSCRKGGGGFGHKFLTQILPFIFYYVSGFSHFLGGHKSKTFRTPSELVPHYKVPPLGGSGLHDM